MSRVVSDTLTGAQVSLLALLAMALAILAAVLVVHARAKHAPRRVAKPDPSGRGPVAPRTAALISPPPSSAPRTALGTLTRDGASEFYALQPADLSRLAVAAQAVDNQWVPRHLLATMLDNRWGLEQSTVAPQRESSIRTEYVRALVNAEQVVINRAYIYNTHAISSDFERVGVNPARERENREAFKSLLGNGVIVPFLLNEETPRQRPELDVLPAGFSAWTQICEEVRTRCVRLSWDQATNDGLIKTQLFRRFHNFAQTAGTGDMDVYLRDLNLLETEADRSGLRRRLGDLATLCAKVAAEGELITRNQLYANFVVQAGSKVPEGHYDREKPYAGEIKQLLDLAYNSYLPDALGGFALTPVDSLPRSALQEWQKAEQHLDTISADDLLNLIRQATFDYIAGGLYLKSMGALSLPDALKVRGSGEWHEYIASVRSLLEDPTRFADEQRGAPAVYRSYGKLAGVMTRFASEGLTNEMQQQVTAAWVPAIQLVVEIAGFVLKVVWKSSGPIYQFIGAVSDNAARRATPVVVRLVVRGLAERQAQSDLGTAIDILDRKMDDVSAQVEALKAGLAELGRRKGFEEIAATATVQEAIMNHAEEVAA